MSQHESIFRTACEHLRPQGDLDVLTSPALKRQLQEAIASGARRVIVDLSAVPFIDSSGLSVLVAGLKAAKLANCQLVLAGIQSQARLIFEVTMADRLFDVFPSADAAMAPFVA